VPQNLAAQFGNHIADRAPRDREGEDHIFHPYQRR
jgi:hypothetical protein